LSVKGGGTIDEEDTWTCRVKTLRPGDHIRCAGYYDGTWRFGEILVIVWIEPHEPCELHTKGIPGCNDRGWYDIRTMPLTCPSEQRMLAMKGDDKIELAARDGGAAEASIPKQTTKKKKPKKGQMDLF
jgi:hypothetical protein